MRILLCNKFYYRRGGDCTYTMGLARLLQEKGHDVAIFAMDHPETVDTEWRKYFVPEVKLGSLANNLRFFARSMGCEGTLKYFRAILDDFRPDVVHMGNIHSQLSPVIAREAHRRGIRVIWTLHDYKLLCPRYDCLRRGEYICEECFTHKTAVLKYSCMKNSAAASAMAWLEALKWNRNLLQEITDIFICPSEFIRDKMIRGGFDDNKLMHLCNFIDVALCQRDDYGNRGDYYCFVGRLSHEKGVRTLVDVAGALPYKLVIIGDGPLMDSLPKSDNIEYTGRKDWPEIKEIVGKARFTVIPSEWYENNPLSVIEALCLGTPVLGAEIGGIPELIQPGRTGACFKSGNRESLAAGIESMFGLNPDYRSIAAESQARFSGDSYYERLISVYRG